MDILFIHLSDIHIENEYSYQKINIESIVNALNFANNIAGIIIVVSGDISYSALEEQFIVAEAFFDDLELSLRNKFNINEIQYIVVPGNHDINRDKSEPWKEPKKHNILYDELYSEMEKLGNFFNFSIKRKCFINNKYVDDKVVSIGKVKIKFNLINSAMFSFSGNDNGFHFLPKDEILKLNNNSYDVDFVISVIHHPPHWFCMESKIDIDKCLQNNSDLVVIGHEHYASSERTSSNNNYCSVCLVSGGELANRGNWENSTFYCGIIDTSTREYSMRKYKYSLKDNIYLKEEENKIVLERKRANKYGVAPREEFTKEFLEDKRFMITDNILNYFVFPLLEEKHIEEKGRVREINDLNEFVKEFEENQKVILLGHNDIGKSTILKCIFQRLIEEYYVIVIDGKQINNKKYDRIIKETFEDIYADSVVEYERFLQVDKRDRVILIDDSDNIEESLRESFDKYIEHNFGKIIKTEKLSIELDVAERLKQLRERSEYNVYEIKPFFKDKRIKLVENVARLMIDREDALAGIIATLCDSLNKQRGIFRMSPDFIVCFVKYYCKNIGDAVHNDGDIFNKVFEANIVSLLNPYAKSINLGKLLMIIDKIAYQIHITRTYPINGKLMEDVVLEYNNEFGSDVDFYQLKEILLKSRIMYGKDGMYAFTEKSYFAYFVARELIRHCQDGDYYEFEQIVKYACYSTNADILLFIMFITDNTHLINRIIATAKEVTFDWEELDFDNMTISYLADEGRFLEVNNITDVERKEIDSVDTEYEKKQEKESGRNNIVTYEDESKELSLLDELSRAMALCMVLSRALPNFEHMMRKSLKDECVALIYGLPLKIFNVWAGEIEKHRECIIEEIIQLQENFYRRDKDNFTEADALIMLRVESISLLLELMNASMGNSTKSSTIRFIDGFNYNDKTTYQLEHLMSLDNRDDTENFVKQAVAIFEKNKQSIVKYMVKRVVRHFMLYSKKIKHTHMQHLNSKLWNEGIDSSYLLLERKKASKKD